MLFGKVATRYIEQALKTGFTHIDTAHRECRRSYLTCHLAKGTAVYRNEQDVGTAIRQSGLARSDLYITTKYGGGADIQQAVRISLSKVRFANKNLQECGLVNDVVSKLGLEQLDMYLIHWPRFIGDDFEGAWREFEKIKDDGLSRCRAQSECLFTRTLRD